MSHYSENKWGLALSSTLRDEHRSDSNESERSESKGFTLIELLVSIAIVSVILTVVVSSQSTYNDGVVLANLADEISSTISQAQVYGIGVREFSPGSSEFSISYGLTFSLLGSGSNIAYLSFADRNGNKIYDGDWSCPIGGASECLGKVDITRNNFIESLCVVRTSGGDLCNVGRVDISFDRPSIEAQLLFFSTGGEPFNPANIKGAKIVLKSPGGLTRLVTVYATGQVSAQ
ncbi:MAG: prepilin-type N-terminal cleavage/methylation domain-containing protein [bacterium]|nr:prepilin-type N-terminal cleavage/methylation domain-containing protein [bacterium]MDZ4205685.1 prepilin-type N-terminal cleavage/methylation domain-containing protein [Patescibacteria group bacterium]